MTRVTCAVASRKRRKRILKLAKGFYGDRKNHIRLTKDAVMKALAYNYIHRKKKKSDQRSCRRTIYYYLRKTTYGKSP